MRRSFKRVLCIGLMVIMVMSCCSTASFGATKSKTMKLYDECYKSGNIVYCIAGDGVYKVNIKTKKKTCLSRFEYPEYQGYTGIRLHKGYLYCLFSCLDYDEGIDRIKVTGKKKIKTIVEVEGDDLTFAISKKKIYYRYYSAISDKYLKKKMKLNGKKKVKTTIKAKNVYRHTNNKRYRVRGRELDDGGYEYYLTTKKGIIHLTTVYYDEDDE